MRQITFNGNKNIISDTILEERKKQNISQAELAAKLQTLNLNLDQQMISKIEKNQRQVTDYELAALLKVLKVNPDTIIKLLENNL